MGYLENATLDCELSWVQSDNMNDTTLIDNGSVKFNYLYTSGTSVGQANCVWYTTGFISSGSNTLIDLFNLNRSIFGGTITMSLSGGSVKSLVIKNLNTGQSNNLLLQVLGNTYLREPFNNQTGTQIVVSPESSFVLNNKFGYNVGTGSRYLTLQEANGYGISYEVSILGVKL